MWDKASDWNGNVFHGEREGKGESGRDLTKYFTRGGLHGATSARLLMIPDTRDYSTVLQVSR